LSSKRILTTQWIDGARITSDAGEILPKHIAIGVDAFATMVLDIGLVHADPHAGNVLITAVDNNLCLLDFGMVVEVPPDHRLAWAKCLWSLIRGDHEGTLQHLIKIGFFPSDCPRDRILEVMPAIWTELVECGSSTEKRKQAVSKCFDEIFVLVREFEFALPDYYLALARAMLTLEGIAISADIEFDIFKAAAPMVIRYLAKQGKAETAQLGHAVTAKMSAGATACCKRLKVAMRKGVLPDARKYGLLMMFGGAGLGAMLVTHARAVTF
jgi:aarF domain-containing kinase